MSKSGFSDGPFTGYTYHTIHIDIYFQAEPVWLPTRMSFILESRFTVSTVLYR